ncbi:MAG: hypothetical protein IJS45_07565 [Clostridia bacterium]|nr:hypothetical protein [Clostridia bacterium]
MPRINALNLLLDTTGSEYLAELYGKVIEGVQKTLVSNGMKNMDLSGDPVSGTVEAKRFVNATSKTYGTARTAGKGDSVKAKPVTIAINVDKEIVEELEEKDVRLYGVDGVLDRRAQNHILRMAAELDTAFFSVAHENANTVDVSGLTSIADILEAVIQACETTKNDFVDGVPRSMMHLVLSPKYYGQVRNDLDRQTNNANVDTAAEEFYTWHGVHTASCVNLPEGCDCLLMVDGAVAQPVMADQYVAEKIPLSNAYGIELFYHYGTACVTPDLIFKTSNPNVTLSVSGTIADSVDLLGKQASDLGTGITVEGSAITGTLKNVTGYTGFSGLAAEQSGNYLALYASSTGSDSVTMELLGGTSGRGEVTLDDGYMIIRVTNKYTQAVRIRAYKGGVVANERVYGLSGLTLLTA